MAAPGRASRLSARSLPVDFVVDEHGYGETLDRTLRKNGSFDRSAGLIVDIFRFSRNSSAGCLARRGVGKIRGRSRDATGSMRRRRRGDILGLLGRHHHRAGRVVALFALFSAAQVAFRGNGRPEPAGADQGLERLIQLGREILLYFALILERGF